MGLLGKLFGGEKERLFQKKVIRLLERHSPPITVQAGDRFSNILFNGVEMDLTELAQHCRLNELQSEELIEQYFSFPLAFARTKTVSWFEAQTNVRPQIVPAAMANRFDVLTMTLAGELAKSVVIKDGQDQYFVRSMNLTNWNVTKEELFNTSILNLDSDPLEMEVTITDGTEKFIGLETHDGFDAARILLPRVRDFAVQKLGPKYFAGIPNRDFMILWSLDCSERFQEYAIEKIENDYSIHGFPLSPLRFLVENDAITLYT